MGGPRSIQKIETLLVCLKFFVQFIMPGWSGKVSIAKEIRVVFLLMQSQICLIFYFAETYINTPNCYFNWMSYQQSIITFSNRPELLLLLLLLLLLWNFCAILDMCIYHCTYICSVLLVIYPKFYYWYILSYIIYIPSVLLEDVMYTFYSIFHLPFFLTL